jgi:hypothetical protein
MKKYCDLEKNRSDILTDLQEHGAQGNIWTQEG